MVKARATNHQNSCPFKVFKKEDYYWGRWGREGKGRGGEREGGRWGLCSHYKDKVGLILARTWRSCQEYKQNDG
jgi:hypothetical protein